VALRSWKRLFNVQVKGKAALFGKGYEQLKPKFAVSKRSKKKLVKRASRADESLRNGSPSKKKALKEDEKKSAKVRDARGQDRKLGYEVFRLKTKIFASDRREESRPSLAIRDEKKYTALKIGETITVAQKEEEWLRKRRGGGVRHKEKLHSKRGNSAENQRVVQCGKFPERGKWTIFSAIRRWLHTRYGKEKSRKPPIFDANQPTEKYVN